MFPYIITPYGKLPSFSLLVACGVLLLSLTVHRMLKKSHCRDEEEAFIFPKIVLCGMIGLVSAGAFSTLFNYIEFGVWKIAGITFYGGLIGAIVSLWIVLKVSRKYTQYSIKEWFDILSPPLVIFHCFGRLGCFFGGCCYGKPTDSFWGMRFPDNLDEGIIHNGQKLFPTQLYEALILLCIFILLFFVKNKFKGYLWTYSVSRFLLEFLRGDERGALINGLSPAQCISTVIIILLIGTAVSKKIKKHDEKTVVQE